MQRSSTGLFQLTAKLSWQAGEEKRVFVMLLYVYNQGHIGCKKNLYKRSIIQGLHTSHFTAWAAEEAAASLYNPLPAVPIQEFTSIKAENRDGLHVSAPSVGQSWFMTWLMFLLYLSSLPLCIDFGIHVQW